MRLLEDPLLLDKLIAFLRERGCIAVQLERGTLEVTIPAAERQDAESMELELYLQLWRAMHPDANAWRLEDPG